MNLNPRGTSCRKQSKKVIAKLMCRFKVYFIVVCMINEKITDRTDIIHVYFWQKIINSVKNKRRALKKKEFKAKSNQTFLRLVLF